MTLLTKAEAAQRAKVSEKTITREIAAGKLTPTRIRGAVRIAAEDLEEYLKKCRSAATARPGKYVCSLPGEGLAALLGIGETLRNLNVDTPSRSKIIALDERRPTGSRKQSSGG